MKRNYERYSLNNVLDSFFDKECAKLSEVKTRYNELSKAKTREIECRSGNIVRLQYNPHRTLSTNANIKKSAIEKRPCFLCANNRLDGQGTLEITDGFELLINPYPILPQHWTIPSRIHQPQAIIENFGSMLDCIDKHLFLTTFYNGPLCGASAPDHLHFQAYDLADVPLQTDFDKHIDSIKELYEIDNDNFIAAIQSYLCPILLINATTKEKAIKLFERIYSSLPLTQEDREPKMNVLVETTEDGYSIYIIPRAKHRPSCYYDEKDKILISPGAVDMAGLIVITREEDFNKITKKDIENIFDEVGLNQDTFDEVKRKIRAI